MWRITRTPQLQTMTTKLPITLILLLLTAISAHIGHDHDHDHDHHHDHEPTDSTKGRILRTDRSSSASAQNKGHTHNCQHDAIEEMLRESKAKFRSDQHAAIAAETGNDGVGVKTLLRRRMESLSKRRKTSSYHKLRIAFDFSRLGDATVDLANGADTHKSVKFTCYEGGPTTVPDSYSATKPANDFDCNDNNKFTPEKRSFLKFTLLPQAKALLENALTVADVDQSITAPNVIWPTAGRCFNSPSTCLPGECTWDKIPTEKW